MFRGYKSVSKTVTKKLQVRWHCPADAIPQLWDHFFEIGEWLLKPTLLPCPNEWDNAQERTLAKGRYQLGVTSDNCPTTLTLSSSLGLGHITCLFRVIVYPQLRGMILLIYVSPTFHTDKVTPMPQHFDYTASSCPESEEGILGRRIRDCKLYISITLQRGLAPSKFSI